MKRTVTLRVEVPDEDAYADVIAELCAVPRVTVLGFTGRTTRVADVLSNVYGIDTVRTSPDSAPVWVRKHS